MFNLCKNKYLETLFDRIRKNLNLYSSIRRQLKTALSDPTQKPDDLDSLRKNYYDLRSKISVSKDHIPSILRDIFDLLLETHGKRSHLATKNLIDDLQKRQIRQSVLFCCAFCGPDSEFEGNKITSKFLDLERSAGDEEYEGEGLIISIKWFIGILEDRSAKKDSDIIKKLRGILDEFEKSIRE